MTGRAALRRGALFLSLPLSLLVGETRRELREPIFPGGDAEEMKLERSPPSMSSINPENRPRAHDVYPETLSDYSLRRSERNLDNHSNYELRQPSFGGRRRG